MDDTTLSKEEAAALLGCSISTLRRKFPVGDPGRAEVGGIERPDEVRYYRSAIQALLPAPGGDTDER